MKLGLVVSVSPTTFDAVAMRGEVEASIDRVAALGYDGVELAIRDPDAVDGPALRAAVARRRLGVPAVGTGQAFLLEGLSLCSREEPVRARAAARLRRHLHLAAGLGAMVIVGLLRGRLEAGDEAAGRARFLDSLRACLPEAEALGVRVVLEPVNRYEGNYLLTLAEAVEVVDALGSPALGLLADTFHMNIEERFIEEALRRAAPRLWHVHVADSNRWAPGMGHLDFAAIVETLRGIGYAGYLSAEILPQPSPEEAARQAMAHLGALVRI
ncbi:MAG: sugar phosphate isomerase/epimerase [Armatimonadetes bacterium]|nr:sugar phosphate isomerase/epimerase [Armatimonadota bacterium]